MQTKINKQIDIKSTRSRWQALLRIDLDGLPDSSNLHAVEFRHKISQQIAHQIEHCIQPSGTVEQMKDSQFIIKFNGANQPETASLIANKLAHQLNSPVSVGQSWVNSKAKIGIRLTRQNEFGDTALDPDRVDWSLITDDQPQHCRYSNTASDDEFFDVTATDARGVLPC
ncbi:MAG: diguanylate cyclase [Halopseudomonas sp.]